MMLPYNVILLLCVLYDSEAYKNFTVWDLTFDSWYMITQQSMWTRLYAKGWPWP